MSDTSQLHITWQPITALLALAEAWKGSAIDTVLATSDVDEHETGLAPR